jgi:hypothetical protein
MLLNKLVLFNNCFSILHTQINLVTQVEHEMKLDLFDIVIRNRGVFL